MMKTIFRSVIGIIILSAAGYFALQHWNGREQREASASEFDSLVVTLRENRNRLEVHRLSGTVITDRTTSGGWGNILSGRMKVKQPWSVSYFADMSDMTLDDYIWDADTRTLLVRAPAAEPEVPNIDESKAIIDTDGLIITQKMQDRLRTAVAQGALKQASDQAAKPENVARATQAARAALAQNIETPLQAIGMGDVVVVVRAPEGLGRSTERWDESRSIAEVLSERAQRILR